MVTCVAVCLRRLGGKRAATVRFGRFVANPRVTVERLIEGWSEQTAPAACGRHVLAIQDTTEVNFATTAERRRGLGEIGKGGGRGVLLHAMLALDARTGNCLGLVAGEVWTRAGRVEVPHEKRPLEAKESCRWLRTADRAKTVLAGAARVTVIADRESDIYAEWALLPSPGFDLIGRVMQDRALADGGSLYEAGARLKPADTAVVKLRARGPGQPKRKARLTLRFGRVRLRRPRNPGVAGLPESVDLTLVEVEERDAPAGVEPIHWRLLTTHEVGDAAAAWQIVDWYKMRWSIEQFFRTLKTQGFQLEDSQIHTADRLLKLTAIAAKAAVLTLQLVQARDGREAQPAAVAFDEAEIAALADLNPRLEGKTALQKNPHPPHSLAWAAWMVARLGGWDGYPSSRPPGPITFRHGIAYFRAFVDGHSFRNVCIP